MKVSSELSSRIVAVAVDRRRNQPSSPILRQSSSPNRDPLFNRRRPQQHHCFSTMTITNPLLSTSLPSTVTPALTSPPPPCPLATTPQPSPDRIKIEFRPILFKSDIIRISLIKEDIEKEVEGGWW
ncbi:hypothetical protein ACFE04_028480 [Oxalis oulophora]